MVSIEETVILASLTNLPTDAQERLNEEIRQSLGLSQEDWVASELEASRQAALAQQAAMDAEFDERRRRRSSAASSAVSTVLSHPWSRPHSAGSSAAGAAAGPGPGPPPPPGEAHSNRNDAYLYYTSGESTTTDHRQQQVMRASQM